jgi:OOP family OmpA-OmpF porin
MKVTLYTILLSLFVSCAFAQYSNEDFKSLGDQAYQKKNYYEAAYYYKKAAERMNLTPQDLKVPFQPVAVPKADKEERKPAEVNYVAYQLAESYRGYDNYLEAEGWYYKVINANTEGEYPLARFWYGICLRANQHFDGAKQQLSQFEKGYHGDQKYITMADKEIANCRFAQDQYKYPILMEVAKLKGEWNPDGSNYAILKRDEGFLFTSSRLIKEDKRRLNRIYHTTTNRGTKPEIVNLKVDDGKKDAEFGTPALNPDGTRMYFTRWYKEGSKTIHAIYRTDLSGSAWGTPKKLSPNVNLDGFSAIQPFVTADGKRLYFVSDKPGGQGGQDIWVSDLDNSGDPVNSTNLGNVINTPQDEQSPYYDAPNKRLVYGSKGFIGLGGFDFFESQGDMGYWNKPRNMGYPINSAKDDLYYYPDRNDATKFYISSDRESDCCLEVFQVTDKRYILSGLIVDCDTHKALPGVRVSFVDSLSKETMKEMTVGRDAKYAFKVATNRPYNLVLEKTGYFTKVVPVNTASGKMLKDTLVSPDLCLQSFEVNKPIVIKNILYDFNKADLRPESKIVLNGLVTILKDNPKIKIELSAHTDSIGSDAYNLNLSQMRAQSCVDYIVSSGINSERIFAKGYGRTKPVAPNSLPNGQDNPDSRQLNRRTEFTVLKMEENSTN